jgi:hypothetical protein
MTSSGGSDLPPLIGQGTDDSTTTKIVAIATLATAFINLGKSLGSILKGLFKKGSSKKI